MPAAVALMAKALAAALVGGELRIYAGALGGESILLASPEFPANPTITPDGRLRFAEFTMSKAVAMGDATWFEGRSREGGVPLVRGTIGKQNANMLVKSTRLYAGMELTLDGFECALKLQGAKA